MIDEIYETAFSQGRNALSVAGEQFELLAALVPSVAAVHVGVELQPRYVERLPEQAILLKLARQISVVSFLNQALETGRIYEQGILQRIADETFEDVTFLALGVHKGLNKLHRKFLAGFWEEDFVDHGEGAKFSYVPQVRRQEIREYIERYCNDLGIQGLEESSRDLYGVFSGYVHGSAAYTFELFDKIDSKFRLFGNFDRAQQFPYLLNAVNYPFRLIMSVLHASQAVRKGATEPRLYAFFKDYEKWLDQFLDMTQDLYQLISFPIRIRRV